MILLIFTYTRTSELKIDNQQTKKPFGVLSEGFFVENFSISFPRALCHADNFINRQASSEIRHSRRFWFLVLKFFFQQLKIHAVIRVDNVKFCD